MRSLLLSGTGEEAILTLEPLIEAVREGIEAAGWELSGLQKTTSHQFEGRWEGESTRSAYLFLHSDVAGELVSIDVYLDETSRGLTGNIALVVDLARLGALGSAGDAVARLASLSSETLSPKRGRPLTLRLRLGDAADPADAAETEVRFKVRIPRRAIREGAHAVRALAGEAVAGFERILASGQLHRLMPEE